MARKNQSRKRRPHNPGDAAEAKREAARAAAREAGTLDRAEAGPFEAEQARGPHHDTDPFEPHEEQALDDAALRRDPQKESGVEQTKHPGPRGD